MGITGTLITSSVVVVIGILLGYIHINDLPKFSKQNVDLAVCILSARNNFHFRDAIRRSWMIDAHAHEDTNMRNKVVAKFVVGKMDCSIHPKDRINIHECQRWEPQIPEKITEITAFSLTSNEDKAGCQIVHACYVKVLHDVILKGLGIIEIFPFHNLSSNDSVQVVLYDSATDEEVTSVNFKDPAGIHSNGYIYKPVQELHLPKVGPLEIITAD